LHHIHSFPLTNIQEFAPKPLGNILAMKLSVLSVRSAIDICNDDTKTSFIIREDSDTVQFKVFMIDVGACDLRKAGQDEQGWREWKALQDEECAIGLVMHCNLKGLNGFKYTRSAESERLIEEFQREKRMSLHIRLTQEQSSSLSLQDSF
jgi:hypothetical protein